MRYIFILLLLTPFYASAQNDTLFFYKDWKIASHRREAAFYRLPLVEEQPGKYLLEDYYISGVLQMRGHYTVPDVAILRNPITDQQYKDGYFEYFYPNGQRDGEGTYVKGKREGIWKLMGDSGTGVLVAKYRYKDGMLHGKTKKYYLDGKVCNIDEYDNGNLLTVTYYDKEGYELPPPPVNKEIMPEPGYNVVKYINSQLTYPVQSRAAGLQGKVSVKFFIDIDGSINHPTVVEGFDVRCDNEALRVIAGMPAWKQPGVQDGRYVKVWYTLPISFTLKGDEKRK